MNLITQIATTAAFLIFGSLPCQAVNLLQNASFEEGIPKSGFASILNGWNVRDVNGVVAFHSISTEKAQDGIRSAMIDIPNGKNIVCYITPSLIQAQGGKNYRLTFYALYPEPQAGVNASAVITLLNAEKKFDSMNGIKTVNITSSAEWKKYTLEYKMPANNNIYYISIRLSLEGCGKIWFDNVSFEEIESKQTIVEFYPGSINDEKTVFAIRNEVCQIMVYTFVDGDNQNISLCIDAPDSFPLLDAVPFHCPVQSNVMQWTKKIKGDRVEYKIPLNQSAVKPILDSAGALLVGEALLFKTSADLVQSNLNWSLWRGNEKLSSDNLQIKGLTDHTPDAALPKYFAVSSWYSPLLNCLNDTEPFSQWLNVMVRSGISGSSITNSLSPKNQSLLEKNGWTNNRTFWFAIPNHCLTGMINNRQYEEFIKSQLNFSGKFDKRMLVWNFEPNLKNDYYHDCSACRQAFENFSGKSTAGFKSSEAIEAKYPEQFLQFRCRQFHDVIKKYGQWCRESNCLSGLVTFSTPLEQGETNLLQLKKLIGDIRSYADCVDYYMPMSYFKPEEFWCALAAMRTFYPGKIIPVVTSDERHNQTTYPYSLNTPEFVRSELLSLAAYGYRQVFLFHGFYVFDGRQILAQRQAMREIAMFEDYLFDGTESDSLLQLKTNGSMLRGMVKKYKGKYLIILFNFDTAQAKIATLSLLLGKGEFSLTEPTANRFFTSVSGSGKLNADDLNNISFSLSPGDVRFFILESAEKENAASLQPAALNSATADVVKQWSILKEGSWECIAVGNAGKTAEKITVKFGASAAEVLVTDGAIISRLTGSAGRNMAMYKEEGQGGLFRDLFWLPESVRRADDCHQPYRVKKIHVSGNDLVMSFEYKLCHPLLAGLIINKEYIFTPGLKLVKNIVSIRNEGSDAKSIAFWSHNRPVLDLKTVEFKISDSETLAYVGNSNTYVSADRISGYLAVADQGTPRFNVIWPKKLLEKLYFWTGGDNPSVEGIFQPVKLESGQSWSAEIVIEIK